MDSTHNLPPCPPAWRPPTEDFEPDEQTYIKVQFGDDELRFLKGHALSVAEILDAMDGYTATFWTTKTHKLVLHPAAEDFDRTYTQPDTRVLLEDGDVFEAVAL